MKHEPAWSMIMIPGLSRYEISETGMVRKEYRHKAMETFFNEKREECVMLTFYGREKRYLIRDLVMKTFGTRLIEDEGIPDISFLAKPEQFSENEEDYGGRGGMEWEEIREAAKKATYNVNQKKYKE